MTTRDVKEHSSITDCIKLQGKTASSEVSTKYFIVNDDQQENIFNLGWLGDILGQVSGSPLTTWGKYVTKDDQRARKVSTDWIWPTKGGWGPEGGEEFCWLRKNNSKEGIILNSDRYNNSNIFKCKCCLLNFVAFGFAPQVFLMQGTKKPDKGGQPR